MFKKKGKDNNEKYYFSCIFGFIGSVTRESITLIAGDSHYLTTVLINISGAFLLAFLTNAILAWFPNINNSILSGISAGLIGGFTTFSTFAVDSIQLINHYHFIGAFFYIFISLGLGYGLALFGNRLGEKMVKGREIV